MQPDPVALGAMIDLACVATNGTPPLTFTWTRDSDGMEVFSSATSGVYSFTVASDNTGSYSCNISNPEGSDATNVTVVLGVAPTGECAVFSGSLVNIISSTQFLAFFRTRLCGWLSVLICHYQSKSLASTSPSLQSLGAVVVWRSPITLFVSLSSTQT